MNDGGSLALEINNGKEEKTAPGRYQNEREETKRRIYITGSLERKVTQEGTCLHLPRVLERLMSFRFREMSSCNKNLLKVGTEEPILFHGKWNMNGRELSSGCSLRAYFLLFG